MNVPTEYYSYARHHSITCHNALDRLESVPITEESITEIRDRLQAFFDQMMWVDDEFCTPDEIMDMHQRQDRLIIRTNAFFARTSA
jgi:hypothetical protein